MPRPKTFASLARMKLPRTASTMYIVKPGTSNAEATRELGKFLRDVMRFNAEAKNFRVFGPDETASNRLDDVHRQAGYLERRSHQRTGKVPSRRDAVQCRGQKLSRLWPG